MTCELHQLRYSLVVLVLCLGLVGGYDHGAMRHEVGRSRRSTWPTSVTLDVPDYSQPPVDQQRNTFTLFNDHPQTEVLTLADGPGVLGKRASYSNFASATSLLPEALNSRLLYRPVKIRLLPVYFHEFMKKRDPEVNTIEMAAPYLDDILYLNGVKLGLLRLPEYSQSFMGKRLRSDIEDSNLWKRIPLELFARQSPHYSHSFVGKRSSVHDDNHQIFDSIFHEAEDTHGSFAKRSATDLKSNKQNPDSKSIILSFHPDPSLPVSKATSPDTSTISYISAGTRTAHSVRKRATVRNNDTPNTEHSLLENNGDYADDGLTPGRLVDTDLTNSHDDVTQLMNFELGKSNSVASEERPDKIDPSLSLLASSLLGKRPSYSHRFLGKRNLAISDSFHAKRPNFAHKFVGKRLSFGHRFVGKRPNFGHKFVGKRPNFGHRFVGKRPNFDDSFIFKRPGFGHRFVGKRLSFGHRFVGKRPSFSHKFVGKRPSFSHKFVGKRPDFGHRFVGKRPDFGHKVVGKRPDFGHRFVGKRPDFGHKFVGKRPDFGHRFVGKRPDFGHRFVGKRPMFSQILEGKLDSDDDHSFSGDNEDILEQMFDRKLDENQHPYSSQVATSGDAINDGGPTQLMATEASRNGSSKGNSLLAENMIQDLTYSLGEMLGDKISEGDESLFRGNFVPDQEPKLNEFFLQTDKIKSNDQNDFNDHVTGGSTALTA